ncbi:MAG: Planctomycete cytochrome, partial [Myxococcales bacterium]|nr:Planctomycete cytochrome [Myxococcales bacterium]
MRSGIDRTKASSIFVVLVVVASLTACTGAVSSGGASGNPTPGSAGGSQSGGAGTTGSAGGAATGFAGTGSGTVGSLPPGTTMTMTAACANAPLATGGAYVRRLTRWEYANTITDLFKVAAPTGLPDLLPADIRANGFSNDFAGQLVSLEHVTAYSGAADAVGASLSKSATWLAPFATCAATTQGTTALCRDQIVRALGLHLFRRPATDAEVMTFGGLFDAAVAAGMTTAPAAAVVVVRGMLQTPQFLYRLERQSAAPGAPARALDNFEIATRLSYFLWSSAPDDALLAAAQAGDLTSPDKLRAQVTRMLSGPHARDVIQRYFREWLSLDDLDDANRGAAFTPQLSADMKQETLDVVGADLWDARHPLLSMFTSKSTIVSPALAKHYGLPAPGAGGRVSTATAPGRTGILTHASVLTVNGDADASIVLRGLYVMRKVLCGDVPAPPPGATSVVLAPATASQRVKSDARLAMQPCQSCHSQFDPLAYAFEPFDNIGALQTKDVNNNAVKADGWIPGAAKVPYTTTDEYMTALVQDPRVGACMAQHVAQFAWGRALQTTDSCLLEDVQGRLGAPETRTFA